MRALDYLKHLADEGVRDKWVAKPEKAKPAPKPSAPKRELTAEDEAELAQYRESMTAEEK